MLLKAGFYAFLSVSSFVLASKKSNILLEKNNCGDKLHNTSRLELTSQHYSDEQILKGFWVAIYKIAADQLKTPDIKMKDAKIEYGMVESLVKTKGAILRESIDWDVLLIASEYQTSYYVKTMTFPYMLFETIDGKYNEKTFALLFNEPAPNAAIRTGTIKAYLSMVTGTPHKRDKIDWKLVETKLAGPQANHYEIITDLIFDLD